MPPEGGLGRCILTLKNPGHFPLGQDMAHRDRVEGGGPGDGLSSRALPRRPLPVTPAVRELRTTNAVLPSHLGLRHQARLRPAAPAFPESGGRGARALEGSASLCLAQAGSSGAEVGSQALNGALTSSDSREEVRPIEGLSGARMGLSVQEKRAWLGMSTEGLQVLAGSWGAPAISSPGEAGVGPWASVRLHGRLSAS